MNIPITTRLSKLVGRQDEKAKIAATIRTLGREARFVLISGIAGIGKTRLLDEVEHIVKGLRKVAGADILCLPILDFYDTAMHSESAIEDAIVRCLINLNHGVTRVFDEFREKLVKYREGWISEDQLWEAFKRGYDEACQGKRIVLRFDTAELLEYEHDDPEVLEDCEVEGLEAPALRWLAEKAHQLCNTAIIIAARPNEDLRRRLKDAIEKSGRNLELIALQKLKLEETKEYFQHANDFGKEVLRNTPEMVEKVWYLSDGRPILISLALDWLQRGMWDGEIYPIDVAELREMHEQGGEEWEQMKRRFEIASVQKIRELDTPLDKATYYAARARKGCDAEILARMMDIPRKKARELVRQLLKLSFVKQPHILPGWRKRWFFLHDEMYDLVEKYVWEVFWPDYTEQERIAERIIEYYNDRIRQIERKRKKAEPEAAKSALQHQRRILLTERLYYQFDHNPQKGLVEYDRLDTQACSERALEWDNLLRIEALRFARERPERAIYAGWITIRNKEIQITDQVNMHCRARWVHRYVARNKYDEYRKAIKIATKLLSEPKLLSKREADELWQARLLVSRAAARERLGRLGGNWLFDEVERDIKRALELLDEVRLNEFNEWIVNYYKATAHVYEGLMARALGELEKASAANKEASALFKRIDYQPGEARALNNRALILARQGRRWEALKACQRALKKQQKAGNEHGTALSLNTLGIIRGVAGDFVGALIESLKALRIFQRRRDVVGIALACINLGWAYRRHGSSDMRKKPEEIEKHFRLAKDFLLQAKEYEDHLEPYYRMEIHNELGCVYKDWANFLALHKGDKLQYYELMGKAGEEFRVADDIAGTALKLEKADNLEDWAWV